MSALETNDPNVIHDDLIRICIQLEGPVENLEEKRRQIDFREVESLSFSFRQIQKIDNLRALDMLTKLQLDNNQIKKIENIHHLVHLTWLDLSFNEITKIEGLSSLTKLTDLSLHSNQISTLENLETLVELNVFSIGNNNLRHMENIMFLRQFANLRLINLSGNPFCSDPEYYNYVLSHMKALQYLDYRLVDKAHVQAAREQYQDQMMELEDKDAKKEEEELQAKKNAENDALMAEANMSGVETLFDDMLKEDAEYQRLRKVKGLIDINEFREKYSTATEDFKTNMLVVHDQKKAERNLWQSVVDKATMEKDEAARKIIVDFEKKKKSAFRDVRDDPSRAEHALNEPRIRNTQMRDELVELEMQMVDILQELNLEFERMYSEQVDQSKALYSTYFGQIRDLENAYFDQVTVVVRFQTAP